MPYQLSPHWLTYLLHWSHLSKIWALCVSWIIFKQLHYAISIALWTVFCWLVLAILNHTILLRTRMAHCFHDFLYITPISVLGSGNTCVSRIPYDHFFLFCDFFLNFFQIFAAQIFCRSFPRIQPKDLWLSEYINTFSNLEALHFYRTHELRQ